MATVPDTKKKKPKNMKKKAKKKKPKSALGIAVAAFDWAGEGFGDTTEKCLMFTAGAKIEILSVEDPHGWWWGRMDGKRGAAPASSQRPPSA